MAVYLLIIYKRTLETRIFKINSKYHVGRCQKLNFTDLWHTPKILGKLPNLYHVIFYNYKENNITNSAEKLSTLKDKKLFLI